MFKLFRYLRSLFAGRADVPEPRGRHESLPAPLESPVATEESSAEAVAAEVPPAEIPPPEPLVLAPILLVGDDLAWLARQETLAGRRVVLANAESPVAAILATEPHDVLVASLADVGQSLALLEEAAAASPATLGLLRANHKELGAIRTSFPVLPRVDSVEVLEDQLRTRLAAAAWQANPACTGLLKKITQVPTLPSVYTQITNALQSPDISIETIADLVSREQAVSAKLLQLVNSPLLGLRGRVTSVRDATSLLGLSRLRSLVLATCLFRQFDAAKCRSFSMSKFEETSLRIANWASAIAKSESRDKQMAEMAFTAGLLHNFGVLLLAVNVPEEYDEILRQAQEQRVSIAWMELQTFGTTHAEIAGGILASWGIPFPIVSAVGWYPAPSASEDLAFSPLTAVHGAVAMETFRQSGMYVFDNAYMERLRLEGKVESWCAKLDGESFAA